METTRWTNPTQPQSLQSSVILLYITAAVGVVFGGLNGLGLVFAVGRVAGGWGCANERKWGYLLAVGIAALPFLLLFVVLTGGEVADHLFSILLAYAFDIILLVLLLVPETRSYQRIWFR